MLGEPRLTEGIFTLQFLGCAGCEMIREISLCLVIYHKISSNWSPLESFMRT